ncbi:MAG: universal stress protein [Pseudomonadota bacterium]
MSGTILIAFDESANARKAITFVADHFTRDHGVTIFHVVPDTAAACGLNSPSLTPYFNSQRTSFCLMESQRAKIVEDMVEQARDLLLKAGFGKDSIQVKIQTQDKSIASDIIQEARSGYDIVVMGRKGSPGIKEYLMGSISQKVLNALEETSLILVE